MMIFLESPWPILVIGIVVEVVLTILLLRTGQAKVLGAIIVVSVLVLLGVLVERWVVTDREAVADTLNAAAAAVEANDLERLLNCVSPKAERTRADSRFVLDRCRFEKARICGLEITVNQLTSPPTARATFRAIGQAEDRRGEVPYRGFESRVTVTMRKEGDRWLIGDYTAEDVRMPQEIKGN